MKNPLYQCIAIIVLAILVGLVLAAFAKSIQHLLTVDYSSGLEVLIVVGQLVFQGLFVLKKGFRNLVNYWFNLMLVSLLGALLLIPLIALDWLYAFNDWILLSSFFGIVAIMFLDHYRRIKKLKLPGYLCYTWVLYRCLILLLIL